ncbi:MAG: GDP-mannose 4,6-dehydratase, partial [Polyangiaceae bacterium]
MRVFRERGHDVLELVGGAGYSNARQIDLRDASSIRRALDGSKATHVLHLAGASSVARSHESPGEPFAINTLGTVHLLDAVHHTIPNAQVVIVSSGEVYGNLDHSAREDDPTNPT